MSLPPQGELPVDSEADVVAARRRLREVAESMGFGVTDVTRIVTAVSELTRNVYQHAGAGIVRWRQVGDGEKAGVEIIVTDEGPGIEDIELAGAAGYSTGKGLGMGLPGTRRLMDEFTVESAPGRGTTIIIRKWLRGSP